MPFNQSEIKIIRARLQAYLSEHKEGVRIDEKKFSDAILCLNASAGSSATVQVTQILTGLIFNPLKNPGFSIYDLMTISNPEILQLLRTHEEVLSAYFTPSDLLKMALSKNFFRFLNEDGGLSLHAIVETEKNYGKRYTSERGGDVTLQQQVCLTKFFFSLNTQIVEVLMSLDKLISDKSPIEGSVIRENVNSKFIIFAKNIFPSVITNMATMHKSQRFAILQSAFQSALDVQKVEAKGKGKERARPVSPLFPEEMDDSLVPHRKKNVAQSSFFSRGASSSTSSSSYVSVSTRVEICKRDLDDLEQYFNAMLRNPSTSATVFYQQIEAAHALLSKLIAFFESEQQLSSRGLLPSCLAEFIVLKIPNGRYS